MSSSVSPCALRSRFASSVTIWKASGNVSCEDGFFVFEAKRC
jgi:hypothetical protein